MGIELFKCLFFCNKTVSKMVISAVLRAKQAVLGKRGITPGILEVTSKKHAKNSYKTLG
jgi:hypothetical protein